MRHDQETLLSSLLGRSMRTVLGQLNVAGGERETGAPGTSSGMA